MSERLNFRDRRTIRSYMRKGLFVGLITIILSIIASYLIIYINPEMEYISNRVIMLGILLALILIWIINRNYLKDLTNGNKLVETGSLVSKYKTEEGLYFSLNNKQFKVESEIWDLAHEGDEVEVHYSFKSKKLLELRLKDKGICNYY